ncbi:ATP-binding cassette domain-containing protein [Streptomyces sp. NPDC004752]
MAVDPLIELRDVNEYGGGLLVLRDIDRTVAAGEVVVVIGPSGSGKSTWCRTVDRLADLRSGTVEQGGRPLPAGGRTPARLRAEADTVVRSFDFFAHRTVLRRPSGERAKGLLPSIRKH